MEQDHVKPCREKGKEKMLSREEVKKKLIGWGIEEPTEEQISDYLAQIGKEIKSSEDRANRYKADAEKVKELTRELDEAKSVNMTEVEKLQKALDTANERLSLSEKTVKDMQMKADLAVIGINGDDASALFNEDGSLNTSKLGEILKARETSAVSAYQEKILDETPSPKGGNPPEDDKDAEVKEYAQAYASRVKANTEAKDIVDSYK